MVKKGERVLMFRVYFCCILRDVTVWVEQACSQVSTVSAKVQAHEWLSHQQPKTSGFFCAIFGVFATFFFFSLHVPPRGGRKFSVK